MLFTVNVNCYCLGLICNSLYYKDLPPLHNKIYTQNTKFYNGDNAAGTPQAEMIVFTRISLKLPAILCKVITMAYI